MGHTLRHRARTHKETVQALTSILQAHPVPEERISKNLSIKYQQVNVAHASNQCFWQEAIRKEKKVLTEYSPLWPAYSAFYIITLTRSCKFCFIIGNI